ncbi:MAG: TIGR03936 family radical SAM-associated protein [Clostridia bacterium]|nr:TIGR03936 family radical SAM-associated protein [Clostridia bacterium]
MKNVRVFFSKKGRLRFVSHLDMNRFFTRVLRKSGLPIWYTEGFNPHPYLTFALPLSLGFESIYEVLDFRLIEDDFPLEEVKNKLSAVLPEYVEIIKVSEPVMKAGKITAAGFSLCFENEKAATEFAAFLATGNVVITKKTKKGDIKVEEVSEKIISVKRSNNEVCLVLPAGNDNLNPSLLVSAFNQKQGREYSVGYTRTALYGQSNLLFE